MRSDKALYLSVAANSSEEAKKILDKMKIVDLNITDCEMAYQISKHCSNKDAFLLSSKAVTANGTFLANHAEWWCQLAKEQNSLEQFAVDIVALKVPAERLLMLSKAFVKSQAPKLGLKVIEKTKLANVHTEWVDWMKELLQLLYSISATNEIVCLESVLY